MSFKEAKDKAIRVIFTFSVMAFVALSFSNTVKSEDRHIGYYYPAPSQIEIYKVRAQILFGADKIRRIGFVTAITQENKKRAYRPTAVLFAKGEDAEKLIIVSLESGRLDTIYRVRAYLASLTAAARTTPVFQNTHVEDILTFFDLVRMLGFEQITVSDGDTFTHQIKFK